MTDNQPDMTLTVEPTAHGIYALWRGAEYTGISTKNLDLLNDLASAYNSRADLCAAVSDAPTDKERAEAFIKPLEWEDYNDRTGKYYRAKSPAGYYEVEKTEAEVCHLYLPYNNGRPYGHYNTAEEAKAIAQKFHDGTMKKYCVIAPDQSEVIKALVEALEKIGEWWWDDADAEFPEQQRLDAIALAEKAGGA